MKPINKRNVVVAAAAALAAGGGGAAIAATQFDSPGARSDAIVSDAAKQLGIQPEALSAALKKAEEDQIDADVAAGRLTKERGDALKSAIEAGDLPLAGFGVGPGLGRLGGVGFAIDLDAASSYLGLTQAKLLSSLRDGKSLAEVAADQGKSVDGLVSALEDAVAKQLDARVAAGTLTQDQKQTIEQNLHERITNLVNRKLPALPRFGGKLGLGGLALPGLESAAQSYLGVTEEQLDSALRDGKTLAGVAADQDKSVDGLVSALVDAAKKELDADVAAGTLTSSQAQEIESDLQQNVTDFVNGTRRLPGLGLGPGSRHFGGLGFRSALGSRA